VFYARRSFETLRESWDGDFIFGDYFKTLTEAKRWAQAAENMRQAGQGFHDVGADFLDLPTQSATVLTAQGSS
jgi:hypothetical protein